MLTRTTAAVVNGSQYPLFAAACVLTVVLLVLLALAYSNPVAGLEEKKVPLTLDSNADLRLQTAAVAALGQRKGAIVVIDPRSGHVRALVNPELAVSNSFLPASTIKPFTTLAALRSGKISPSTKVQCQGVYRQQDFMEKCSHPRHLGPFQPADALGYSCNYYFARVGEQLHPHDLDRVLSEFGFGSLTRIDVPNEQRGIFNAAESKIKRALGEDTTFQVTPIQLLIAYSALLNGGQLLRPQLANGEASINNEIKIIESERRVIVEGMRKAVTLGTAVKSGLSSLPVWVIGKTGTAAQSEGVVSDGWFVGFASKNGTVDTVPEIGVVVFLARAHGDNAAEVSRPIFEAFAKPDASSAESSTCSITRNDERVVVHQVTENTTRFLSLEEYVARVVATEGSVENEPEALKALAVAVRTFALKNLGRHQAHGFDFCSTTHCQRFASLKTKLPSTATAAALDTRGLVLKDSEGKLIESFFGASCGGLTANYRTLWGGRDLSYLQGVHDEYCSAGPHYRWTDAIESPDLARALRSDQRTDVGETIHNLQVVRQDESGRATVIKISGSREVAISGWEFKLIVGRSLGWNVLKSSRFSVSQSGARFVFRGGGFGHGLGLCQEGAHEMAQRGFTFKQILSKYFPGTTVSLQSMFGSHSSHADVMWAFPLASVAPAPVQRSLDRKVKQFAHGLIRYPATTPTKDVEQTIQLIERLRSGLQQRLRFNEVNYELPPLEIALNETTGDFVGRTGQAPWAAAATDSRRIELQPLKVLQQRRILETTLRHELVHVVIDDLGHNRSPKWLEEGFAMYVAGEGTLARRSMNWNHLSHVELDHALDSASSADAMRLAYSQAYNAVRQLVAGKGEAQVWKMIVEKGH